MATGTVVHDPIVAADRDQSVLKELARAMESHQAVRAHIVGPDAREITIPESLYTVLVEAVHLLAQGNGVRILPVTTELTTQQAADLLNVSRPFVVKLLETKQIPFHKAGTHRRIILKDLLSYKARRDAHAHEVLDELVAQAQELGLYDE
jgi:excisionase family DNA binding protein